MPSLWVRPILDTLLFTRIQVTISSSKSQRMMAETFRFCQIPKLLDLHRKVIKLYNSGSRHIGNRFSALKDRIREGLLPLITYQIIWVKLIALWWWNLKSLPIELPKTFSNQKNATLTSTTSSQNSNQASSNFPKCNPANFSAKTALALQSWTTWQIWAPLPKVSTKQVLASSFTGTRSRAVTTECSLITRPSEIFNLTILVMKGKRRLNRRG